MSDKQQRLTSSPSSASCWRSTRACCTGGWRSAERDDVHGGRHAADGRGRVQPGGGELAGGRPGTCRRACSGRCSVACSDRSRGAGFAFLTPSAQALISRRSDPEKQGEILGVNQSASAMARILGAVIGVTLYLATADHILPYLVGGGLMLLLLVLIPRDSERRCLAEASRVAEMASGGRKPDERGAVHGTSPRSLTVAAPNRAHFLSAFSSQSPTLSAHSLPWAARPLGLKWMPLPPLVAVVAGQLVGVRPLQGHARLPKLLLRLPNRRPSAPRRDDRWPGRRTTERPSRPTRASPGSGPSSCGRIRPGSCRCPIRPGATARPGSHACPAGPCASSSTRNSSWPPGSQSLTLVPEWPVEATPMGT